MTLQFEGSNFPCKDCGFRLIFWRSAARIELGFSGDATICLAMGWEAKNVLFADEAERIAQFSSGRPKSLKAESSGLLLDCSLKSRTDSASVKGTNTWSLTTLGSFESISICTSVAGRMFQLVRGFSTDSMLPGQPRWKRATSSPRKLQTLEIHQLFGWIVLSGFHVTYSSDRQNEHAGKECGKRKEKAWTSKRRNTGASRLAVSSKSLYLICSWTNMSFEFGKMSW